MIHSPSSTTSISLLKVLVFMMTIYTNLQPCKYSLEVAGLFLPVRTKRVYMPSTYEYLPAGGPGKGMYSRLYTHILNHHAAIDHCASFHHIYNDSSLFGLFASFAPSAKSAVLPHLIHQLALLLYRAVPPEELSRAKNQLKSSLAMALESRSVEVEDLGRQVSRRVLFSDRRAKRVR